MLEKIDVDLDVSDVKRLKLDFPCIFKCPQCGGIIKQAEHAYLSYVVKDTSDTIPLYCTRCEGYFSLPVHVESIKICMSYNPNIINEG